jgi:phosphoribosylanthranilate isomerase
VPPAEDYARLHLDASGDPLPGGSTDRPDWEVCRRLVDAHPGRKLLLAGGITPENVVEALQTVRPWGVDVSSGVESAPGRKDAARIRALLEAVAAYDATPQ